MNPYTAVVIPGLLIAAAVVLVAVLTADNRRRRRARAAERRARPPDATPLIDELQLLRAADLYPCCGGQHIPECPKEPHHA